MILTCITHQLYIVMWICRLLANFCLTRPLTPTMFKTLSLKTGFFMTHLDVFHVYNYSQTFLLWFGVWCLVFILICLFSSFLFVSFCFFSFACACVFILNHSVVKGHHIETNNVPPLTTTYQYTSSKRTTDGKHCSLNLHASLKPSLFSFLSFMLLRIL